MIATRLEVARLYNFSWCGFRKVAAAHEPPDLATTELFFGNLDRFENQSLRPRHPNSHPRP